MKLPHSFIRMQKPLPGGKGTDNRALGQKTTQQDGAEAMLGDRGKLESDYPSIDDETQQQPNAFVQRENEK